MAKLREDVRHLFMAAVLDSTARVIATNLGPVPPDVKAIAEKMGLDLSEIIPKQPEPLNIAFLMLILKADEIGVVSMNDLLFGIQDQIGEDATKKVAAVLHQLKDNFKKEGELLG